MAAKFIADGIAARLPHGRARDDVSHIGGGFRNSSAGSVLEYIFHQDRVVAAQKTLPNPVSCSSRIIEDQGEK